jgi:hypothetical protein
VRRETPLGRRSSDASTSSRCEPGLGGVSPSTAGEAGSGRERAYPSHPQVFVRGAGFDGWTGLTGPAYPVSREVSRGVIANGPFR